MIMMTTTILIFVLTVLGTSSMASSNFIYCMFSFFLLLLLFSPFCLSGCCYKISIKTQSEKKRLKFGDLSLLKDLKMLTLCSGG